MKYIIHLFIASLPAAPFYKSIAGRHPQIKQQVQFYTPKLTNQNLTLTLFIRRRPPSPHYSQTLITQKKSSPSTTDFPHNHLPSHV
ncbi:hypothetical protein Hanom_Chr05g00416801 [Helianthus anomalus]